LTIEASSHHYVTPALAWCAQADPRVPADIRGYLDAVLTLNGRRNEYLLGVLARVIEGLNAAGIEPVLLKGGAHLVEGIYPTTALRVVGDLDILIQDGQRRSAVAALRNIGFAEGGSPLPETHHHLRMLCDRETGAGVELHLRLGRSATDAIVPAAWIRRDTRIFAFRGMQVRLPEMTRHVGHNVAHGQIDHGGYLRGRTELRQLLDLAMMRTRHEAAIDWAELDRRFSDAGLGPMLATYLHFAEVFFGQAMPRLSHAPRTGAVAKLRRIIDARLNWWDLAAIPKDYLASRRGNPLGILDFLNPGTWRRGVQSIARRARPNW
jgi:hypothetical protein